MRCIMDPNNITLLGTHVKRKWSLTNKEKEKISWDKNPLQKTKKKQDAWMDD